jgi:thioredoxin reductase (NADPH)
MAEDNYDVIILGSGPAGLQAAIHAVRRKASVLVLGRIHKSSAYGAHIENFCCVEGDMGVEMLNQGRKKAEAAGTIFMDENVTGLSSVDGYYQVHTEGGRTFGAGALILAMGISRNKLGLKNEKALVGKGVSYCVDCDGFFFKNETVAVVGNESAAVSGALTLLFLTDKVHLICDKLEVADYMAEKIRQSNIQMHENRKVTQILGDDKVTGIVLDDGTTLDVTGIFIELGAKGAIALAGELGVMLDPQTMKYVEVNKKQETNLPGVYAAGDICGPPWQVAKAVGEGCIAGLEAASFALKKKKA